LDFQEEAKGMPHCGMETVTWRKIKQKFNNYLLSIHRPTETERRHFPTHSEQRSIGKREKHIAFSLLIAFWFIQQASGLVWVLHYSIRKSRGNLSATFTGHFHCVFLLGSFS
jgi:hypothetical protein